jgi:hypothetical protein
VTDWTNRLQVFGPDGAHLCTRKDIKLNAAAGKAIAWGPQGELAIVDYGRQQLMLWHAS